MNRIAVTFAATTATITLFLAATPPTNAADSERTPTQVRTMSLVTAASQRAAASARLTPSAAAAARPNLAVGASNPAVIYVQQRLGVQPVSGYFGPITLAAVKAFQKQHNLTRSGTVNAATWAALLSAKSAKSNAAAKSRSKAAEKAATASRKAAAAKKAAAKAEAAKAASRRTEAAKKAAAKRAAAAKEAAAKAAAAKEAAAKAAAEEAAAKAAAEKAAREAASLLTPEQAAQKRPMLQFDMGPGDPAVVFVQRYLKVSPQSGYFGAMTREAVLAFQRGLGIPASGIVGPRTWQAIFDGKSVDTAPIFSGDADDPEAPTLSADQPQGSSAVTTPSNATIPTPTYRLPANPTAADKALVYALAQVGKPYVLGGNGPGVYDCSGLVQQAYLSAGVSLPRLASQQQFAGTEVTLETLLPGDLLYYQDGSSPRRGHISMYAGNGLVVEAANPRRGVRIRPLNESWYAERFVRAVHISG